MNTVRKIIIWSSLLFSLLLIAQLVVWSISFRWHFPSIWPQALTLRAWRLVTATNSRIFEAIITSILLSSAVTAINIVVALPAAFYIHALRTRGKLWANICVLLPLLVPPLAVIMGSYQFMIKIGLINNALGVIIVHLLPTLPYMIIVIQAILHNTDLNYLAISYTLGASRITTIRRVLLPLIMPGLLTGVFFVFLISWSQYLPTLIVGGGRVVTIPILLFVYATAGDYALMAMCCVLLILPTLILLRANAKYITGKAYYAQNGG